MEALSSSTSSSLSAPVENKRKAPESHLNKKVTCLVKNILVDLCGVYFDNDQAIGIIADFPSSPRDPRIFYIIHSCGSISSWVSRDQKAILKALYHHGGTSIAVEHQTSFIICQYDNTVTFLDEYSLHSGTSLEYIYPNSFLFDGYIDDVNGASFYMGYDSGMFQKMNLGPFGSRELCFDKKLDNSLYIKSLKMLKSEIIAACNSTDKEKPLSCIQWFDEDGELIKAKLESEKLISSFTLVKNIERGTGEILLVYEDNSILKHDIEADTTILIEPFVEGPLTLSLFSSYFICYQPGLQNDAFLLDRRTLEICYQIDFGTLYKTNEFLVSINGSKDRKEHMVTTTTKVYECDLFFETQPGQDAFEASFKRQKR